MSTAINLKYMMNRSSRALIDFMHGGLVMTGAVVTISLAAFIAGNPAAIDNLRSLRQVLFASAPAAPADNAEPADAAVADTAAEGPRLAANMQVAVEAAARRYRVSAVAIEPVFAAAQKVGRQLALDPLLIVAVIGVESGFNPLSESVMGAQGLMQIVPRFHKDKLPEGDNLALFDPETNVSIGARVLKDSIRRMGSLTAGLQQFAGAPDDPEQVYANKVLAEKQRLEAASRRSRAN